MLLTFLLKRNIRNSSKCFSETDNQDLTGVSPQLCRNLDSLWLFGGNVCRQNFMYLLNQCYTDVKDKKEIIWDNYGKLSVNEILLFSYDCDGIKLEVL
jgi:hypothetical protein